MAACRREVDRQALSAVVRDTLTKLGVEVAPADLSDADDLCADLEQR